MHLVGPYMTTTNYKKRKQKGITKRDKQANIDHDKWLRKMGVHPEQLEAKKAQRTNDKNVDVPSVSYRNSNTIPTSDRIDGVAPRKAGNQYTGDYIIGITTTHKSNIVPITSKKQAIEASQMRRN
jgi:hypothetical protein